MNVLTKIRTSEPLPKIYHQLGIIISTYNQLIIKYFTYKPVDVVILPKFQLIFTKFLQKHSLHKIVEC